MLRRLLLIAFVPGALAMLPSGSAVADHGCNGTVTAVGPLYLEDRPGGDPVDWIYLESNGVAGLQSGGFHVDGGAVFAGDPCAHANPDTLIY